MAQTRSAVEQSFTESFITILPVPFGYISQEQLDISFDRPLSRVLIISNLAMQFLLLNLSPLLFFLLSKSCIAEDSTWNGNTEVEASEQTNSHLDGSITSPVPGVGQLSLDTPAPPADTPPLIASDASCALPKENSQRRKKSRRNGFPNDACVAPMQLQASPATETKPNLRPGDTKTNPNSGVPGNQKRPQGGPAFESLSWSAPWTLRTGDERCPNPLFKIPVCAFGDDLAFVGIPLDLGVVYPRVWPFLFSVLINLSEPENTHPPYSTKNTDFSLRLTNL